MSRLEAESVFTVTGSTPAVSREFVFFLLPSFSPMSVCAAIEVLSQANASGANPAYAWRVISQSGAPMTSQTGVTLDVDGGLGPIGRGATIVICGGQRIDEAIDRDVVLWLRKSVRHGAKCGALGGAVSLLAEHDLATGQKLASHWSVANALQELHPDIEVTRSVFELSDNVMSCAGNAATLDLFLNLVASQNSENCARDTAATLVCSNIRDGVNEQTMSRACYLGRHSPYLERAIELMHQNIETPISPVVIADEVGISSRQLERLFAKHLGITPKAYSTKIRLEQARVLLQQTRLSTIEVALATGFQSPSHFSKLYKIRFGISPAAERGFVKQTTATGQGCGTQGK